MKEYPTKMLDEVLESTSPEQANDYFEEYEGAMISGKHPFADYFRSMLKKKGMTQLSVAVRAGFSERYGYRLISQGKNTRQRDYILRLCFAAHLNLKETQHALRLYGMSELYAKLPRDAVMIIALNQGVYDLEKVDEMLIDHGMEKLQDTYKAVP